MQALRAPPLPMTPASLFRFSPHLQDPPAAAGSVGWPGTERSVSHLVFLRYRLLTSRKERGAGQIGIGSQGGAVRLCGFSDGRACGALGRTALTPTELLTSPSPRLALLCSGDTTGPTIS